MKKLFLAMIVCAGFCACSNDDVVVTTTPNEALGEAVAYLTVNIKDVNSGTRATDGGFAYGTEAEQKVANAYFYFYDDNGNYMANGSLGSISGTAATETTPNGNIEWNSGTVVAVYGLDDSNNLPTKMITVLNKPSSVNLQNKSLDEALATLATTPYADASGNFVMSTSVYDAGSTTGIVNYTALESTDFATEPIDLETDYADGGVAVYVERLAAKVVVNDGIREEGTDGYIDITENVAESFANGAPEGGVYVKLDGFDVDGVARDAYLVKSIQDDSNWSSLTFVWNGAGNYRCYWAESPNYGDTQTVYPTSSNGNTATEENNSSTWLNDYLRYVDLKDPVEFESATYCGENTNTAGTNGVITAIDNNGLTNVLVKGTVYTMEDEEYVPLELVEFHGMYYTAEEFTQKCVDDVVNYDFTVVVDEVIAALEAKYSTLTTYLEDLNGAIVKDHIYKSTANENHKYGTSVTGPSEVTPFGGEMLSLYNAVDGNVNIFYNGAQPYWGEDGTSSGTPVGSEIIAKYPESDIVYGGADLDKYDFWFHVDQTKFNNFLTKTGLTAAGLLYEVDGEYYMPIDNSISFSTQAMGDDTFSGGHTYTTRNFLLRTITVEADGIDSEFGSHYPNLYAKGGMYYHVPIEHLGSPTQGNTDLVEGQYGVVRNHYYNVTITSLENLGRGIADPEEVIVPLPDVTYYYLGADINILSWKMINQSVGF